VTELGIALGLILVIEGVLYALFPGAMRRFMVQALAQPPETLRRVGLMAALFGFAVIWLIKG